MAHMKRVSSEHDQLNVEDGIQRYGDKAIEAVLKEFVKLIGMTTFDPLDASTLTLEQKRRALKLITKIKRKRCGKIKGSACADGSRQRRYIRKDEVTSPKIQLESFIISLLLDAFEGRSTATADIVSAYLLTTMKDFVVVKIVGESVNIICEVNAEYKNFVTQENGKPVLYMKLRKALYGYRQSTILWYEAFTGTLKKKLGFTLNPYDPCVANMTIRGKQCTVVWYVEDTKISH